MRNPLPTAAHRPSHFIQLGSDRPPPATMALSEARAAVAEAMTLDNDFIASDADTDAADCEAEAPLSVAVLAVDVRVDDMTKSRESS
jgi:hypothetical protein